MFAAFTLISIGVNAALIDANTAQRMAQHFVSSQAGTMLQSGNAEMRLSHAEASLVKDGSNDYYVFNASNGKAFVIVSGDDRVGEVLGYGEGNIDMDDLPCGMQWLLNDYREQMEYLYATPTAQVERQHVRSDINVLPMLSCLWSQSEPYYNQCPMYSGQRSVTGCIATAMAQVMYYWRYPEQLPSLSGYTTRSLRISVQSLPPTRLDWDNMIDSYIGEYTTEQANAVATLMRYCGQSSRMDYSPSGSGAYVYQQLQGMTLFGYGSQASNLHRSDYTSEEWDELVLEDLIAGRPVLYSGNDPMAGGHAFVVDGYYDGLFHLNWGWAGTGNGYFRLNGLVVRGYSFLAAQEILHHICPREQVEPIEGKDFEKDGIYYMYDEEGHNVIVTYNNTRFDCYSGEVVIPEVVDYDGESLPVIGISEDAFRDCTGLTAVHIPATVTTIGERAFRNCIGLTSVSLPDGLIRLGNQAFANCMKLTGIDFPATLVKIGKQAFIDCYAMTHVGTTSLESWLNIDFADQYANPLYYVHHLTVDGQELSDVVIPSSVSKIKPLAFIECDGLKSVKIADGVNDLGESAFAYCDGISSLSLPSSLQTIGKQAFQGCTALTDVVIPVGVKSLPDGLFMNCTGLKGVSIPNGVVSVGKNVFNGCSAMQKITLPNSVNVLAASAFAGCSSLRKINLSRCLNAIGDNTFQGCTSLSRVVIPDSVKTIGYQAFYKCANLNNITIGSSVLSLGVDAFRDCPKISVVTCRPIVPPSTPNPDCFTRSIYNKATLRVPVASYHDYKNSGIWPWFKNMIGTNVDTVMGDVNGDGEVNIADINAIIDCIFLADGNAACDVNADGDVNIADVNTVIDYLLLGI